MVFLSVDGFQSEMPRREKQTNRQTEVSSAKPCVLIDLITDVTALLKPSQDQIAKITKLSRNIKIGFSVSQVVLVQDQPVLLL